MSLSLIRNEGAEGICENGFVEDGRRIFLDDTLSPCSSLYECPI